jgi:hypothetical protein
MGQVQAGKGMKTRVSVSSVVGDGKDEYITWARLPSVF